MLCKTSLIRTLKPVPNEVPIYVPMDNAAEPHPVLERKVWLIMIIADSKIKKVQNGY